MTQRKNNKYFTHVEPRLLEIEAWARNGVIEKDIAKNLGIAYSTFKTYKKQYSALSDALKNGKEVIDIKVENTLLKKALGYEYEEEEIFIEEVDGVIKKRRKVLKKVAHPDTTALIFWLKNRNPEMWRDRRDLNHQILTPDDITIEIGGIELGGSLEEGDIDGED